jgi:hypothetical protein
MRRGVRRYEIDQQKPLEKSNDEHKKAEAGNPESD